MRWVACALLAGVSLACAPVAQANLSAGAGRADITPKTGYYFMGWVRSDARAMGVHARLFVRALVLENDGRKVALVAADLGAVPNGMIVDAAELLAGRGFTDKNIVVSASHTHGAQAGYFNFSAFNTIAPTPNEPATFEVGEAADPQLYTFMVRQIAAAIRRADSNRAPAVAGWGHRELLGLTDNRSIEAHLANHGIEVEFGEGNVGMDPDGYRHTIDPEVHVLRVDKVVRGRRLPIGAFSTFSNHGTVNKPTFQFYNADHHGSAARVFESQVRRLGRVPRGQDVVNAFGNTDEGDVSSGLDNTGPAAADLVGRREARAMVSAWRSAGKRLNASPALDFRWTRACFCGNETEGGAVDDTAVVGLPFLTGSEENRGGLFDVTHEEFEGRRLPVGAGAQGHKIRAYTDVARAMPRAVPLTAVRVGDRMIVTMPGEMTAEMGRRVRAAVLDAARSSGVRRVVISGLANEFIQYFTTPEEYDRQHYEGGSMLYGRTSSNFIRDRLVELGSRLAAGQPAPDPFDFDPKNGVSDDGPPYPRGAANGSVAAQPRSVRRLSRAEFSWRGAPEGLDRPLERAFLTIQRRQGRRWRKVTDDLGLQILWSVDGQGVYTARWEVPPDARLGRYRFVVTANGYRLASAPFAVGPATSLEPRVVSTGGGRATLALDYPAPVKEVDFTHRPRGAHRWQLDLGGGEKVVVRRGSQLVIRGAPGSTIEIGRGAARDRYGNTNTNTLRVGL